MTVVTVSGAHNSTVSLSYDSEANAVLARQIAGAIKSGLDAGTIKAADSADGPPPGLLPGVSGEFVQSTKGTTVLSDGYTFAVNAAKSAIIFGSGDENQGILSGSGNLKFFSAGGSGSVVAGGGNNQIVISPPNAGDWLIATGDGNDTIRMLGGGTDTIGAGGGKNIIQLGSGNSFVTTTGKDTILASHGSETIAAFGSNTSNVVYGMDSNLYLIAGGGATVFGGSGSDTVFGGEGPMLVYGGTDGHNFLQAGEGRATLFAGGDGDQLFAGGSEAQALHAASGNTTLFGGFASGNDTFYGGSGQAQIFGGTGKNTFVAGTGEATVTAGPGGHNLFEFINGEAGGTELIRGLTSSSQVHIELVGYSSKEVAEALKGQTHTGNGITITLSDNTRITFENISGLTKSNFSKGGDNNRNDDDDDKLDHSHGHSNGRWDGGSEDRFSGHDSNGSRGHWDRS